MLIDHTLYGVVDKVADAIAVLREYEPPEGYYVAFSGGKDSLCIYWLTKLAGVKADYHYNYTTVDPPELVAFVRTFSDVQIEHPGADKTMWALIAKHGVPPTRRIRYCCSTLKEGGGKGRVKVLGVRAEESSKRKGRQVVELSSTLGRVVNLIYNWTMLDVWEFIGCNMLDYCSLYDEGFDRLGCVGCPLQGVKGMERDFAHWPLYRAAYVRAFDRMLAERQWRDKANQDNWQTGEDVMQWWLHGSDKVDGNQLLLWEVITNDNDGIRDTQVNNG